jgi:hypothetical protein
MDPYPPWERRCLVQYVHDGERDVDGEYTYSGLSVRKIHTRPEIACMIARLTPKYLESVEELDLEYNNPQMREIDSLAEALGRFFGKHLRDYGFRCRNLHTLNCSFQHHDDYSEVEPHRHISNMLDMLATIADVCGGSLVTVTGVLPPYIIPWASVGAQLTRFKKLRVFGMYESTIGSREESQVRQYAHHLADYHPGLQRLELACYAPYNSSIPKRQEPLGKYFTVDTSQTPPTVVQNGTPPSSMYKHDPVRFQTRSRKAKARAARLI